MDNNQPNQQFNNFNAPPENYLVWAILSTFLCCMPLGIVAIIKANSVNSLWYQGLHEEAYKASKSAKQFAIWSAISASIVWVLYIMIFVVIGVAGGLSEY